MDNEPLDFYTLVENALEDLPKELAALLDNIVITIEDWPSPDEVLVKEDPNANLYGLYEGVPLTERGPGYYGVMPDRITIFRGPLERDFPDEELEEQVQITVIHELAHHFGFDEDKLEELGWG
ncbi:metallopeptidase family protein [Rubrobacter indicoceani]|uniref:metallopeptidase family protein n=1 Tax=Rubrobacter indicoceani TaxID=2051957 RepID=UPI000E5BD827|nr:metallopeptidase family protein [Rubrobacter indicoceani]